MESNVNQFDVSQTVEVRAGVEPANNGFADRRLRPLGYRTPKNNQRYFLSCWPKGLGFATEQDFVTEQK